MTIDRYSHPEMSRLWTDQAKFERWLQVELAVAEAWAEMGEIPKDAIPVLRKATVDAERVKAIEATVDHDVIAFIQAVSEGLGSEARYLHLGLTSSDVIDTALALQVRDSIDVLIGELNNLEQLVTSMALRYRNTLMIGRTHGVHAEPTTFGYKLLVWVEELRRHRARLLHVREEISYGKISGAVGTHATVPPEVEERACFKLGLKPEPVATQVVQRDRHAAVVLALALLASSLEKFATEIRHLQRTEVREVEEPFAPGQKGSSAMPHKRNPHKCERITGLARVVRSNAVAALEDIPLWHERDISHSSVERIILPGAFGLVAYMVRSFRRILEGLVVYPERMMTNLEMTRGLVFSQRVLLALIEKGMSRQQAYDLVQRLAMEAWDKGVHFKDLLAADDGVSQLLSQEELERLFDYQYFLKYLDTGYRRLGLV
jgi:adenylosuccinate lyase